MPPSTTTPSTAASSTTTARLKKELASALILLLVGLVLVTTAIYVVGQGVFGDYDSAGFSSFFGAISAKVRNGDWASWFLILSPYLGWLCIRAVIYVWRRLR